MLDWIPACAGMTIVVKLVFDLVELFEDIL